MDLLVFTMNITLLPLWYRYPFSKKEVCWLIVIKPLLQFWDGVWPAQKLYHAFKSYACFDYEMAIFSKNITPYVSSFRIQSRFHTLPPEPQVLHINMCLHISPKYLLPFWYRYLLNP